MTNPSPDGIDQPRAVARDYPDIAAGLILVVLGMSVAQFSMANYALGDLRQMGPGLFPAALGYILAGMGLIIAVAAAFRPGKISAFNARPMIAIVAALLAFSSLIQVVGLVPAVAVTSIISSFADNKVRLVGKLALAAALCLLTYLIFIVGLRLPIAAIRIPV